MDKKDNNSFRVTDQIRCENCGVYFALAEADSEKLGNRAYDLINGKKKEVLCPQCGKVHEVE